MATQTRLAGELVKWVPDGEWGFIRESRDSLLFFVHIQNILNPNKLLGLERKEGVQMTFEGLPDTKPGKKPKAIRVEVL